MDEPRVSNGTDRPVLDYGTGRTPRVRPWIRYVLPCGVALLVIAAPIVLAAPKPRLQILTTGAVALVAGIVAAFGLGQMAQGRKGFLRRWLPAFGVVYLLAIVLQAYQAWRLRPTSEAWIPPLVSYGDPCQKRMRALSELLAIYYHKHHRYPDRLEDALALDKTGRTRGWCPSADPHGSSEAAYVYLAKGKTQMDVGRIILYERLENHPEEGINVLPNHLLVQRLAPREAKALLSRLEAEAKAAP